MGEALVVETPTAGVTVLRLNRPERLNALNHELVGAIEQECRRLADDTATRAVVITGAGRGFCSGLDVRDFGPGLPAAHAPLAERMRFQERMASLPLAVRALPQAVIAAVNGPCVGGGFALCLAADVRLCSTAASFGNGAILLGLSGAEMGMSYHLPRIVGTSVAADWMLTGRTVPAEEADRRGLVEPARRAGRAAGPGPRAGGRGGRVAWTGRADDKAGLAGQHRCGRCRRRPRAREPQPGAHARHGRLGGAPGEVGDVS